MNHTRRKISRRGMLKLAASTALAASAPSIALAQKDYPNDSIKFLVGFPPGGTTDVLGRVFAEHLGKHLGQNILVENKPGVSGMIASKFVADARPDGYTLLFSSSTLGTYKALYGDRVKFDPVSSFTPIGLLAATPYLLVVHPSLPVHNMAELIEYARANPGKISYAASSPGGGQHLGWELIKRSTDTDMQYVAYKGSGELFPDLISGRLQAAIDNIAIMRPHVDNGSLRPIAVTSKEESPVFPGIPPIAQMGGDLANFEVIGWFGLFAPAGCPPEIVQTLAQATREAVQSEDIRNRLSKLGAQVMDGTPESMRDLLSSEIQTWTPIIKDLGLEIA